MFKMNKKFQIYKINSVMNMKIPKTLIRIKINKIKSKAYRIKAR